MLAVEMAACNGLQRGGQQDAGTAAGGERKRAAASWVVGSEASEMSWDAANHRAFLTSRVAACGEATRN